MPRVTTASRAYPVSALDSSFVQEGCILWLRKRDEIDAHLLATVSIEDGCYNHPVVVLSANLVERTALVLIVSICVFEPAAEVLAHFHS